MKPRDLVTGMQSKFHEMYKKVSIDEHQLSYLFLELTQKCNLDCLHCGSDCSSFTEKAELTTESWLKIVDYIANTFSNKVNLVLTGGEPLMFRDLLVIGKHIKTLKMKWGMVTNGMLLTTKKLSELEQAGMESITLSVDGLQENHNWLRNHNLAFEKLQHALTSIGNSCLSFKDAVTCVHPRNLSELDRIAEMLIKHGITSWRLFRIFPSGRATDNADLYLSFQESHELLKWIEENKKHLSVKGLSLNLSCEGWLPFAIDKKVRDSPFFCRAGINFASILNDGTITGCTNNHSSFYEGNIMTDSFQALWELGFAKFRTKKWLEKTDCFNCNKIKLCRGSSIHLWELPAKQPKFCYHKDFHSKLL